MLENRRTSKGVAAVMITGLLGLWAGTALAAWTPPSFELGGSKWTLGLDLRYRWENKNDFDLNADHADHDGLSYLRSRLRLEGAFGERWKLMLEGLDAREWDSRPAVKSQKDTMDLHQAFISGNKLLGLPLDLTVGRQKLEFGAKRLVAAPMWSNKIRSFDALKLRLAPKDFALDAFFANVVQYEDGHFNQRYEGSDFWGLYFTWKGIKGHAFDLYSLNLTDSEHPVKGEDGTSGDLKRYTTGARAAGSFLDQALEYGVEFVRQSGDYGDDAIRAHAVHADLAWRFKTGPWTPKVFIEFNLATGDDDLHDGRAGTFNPLYQTTHDPYGILDLFRWQNMREIALGVDLAPTKTTKLNLQAHRYNLDSTRDAWYDSGGKALRRASGGTASDLVGDEASIVWKWKFSKPADVEAGYAHFFAGPYTEQSGASDDVDWFYVQTTVSF